MANKYGLQLYSVLDTSDTDLRGTLKAVAEMGYNKKEASEFSLASFLL